MQFLEKSCHDWNIWNGIKYLESSKLGLNRQLDTQCSGTRHNIHDFHHFVDWMYSRAAQAEVLKSDMNQFDAYQHIDKPMVLKAAEPFLHNFAERYVQAVYGFNYRQRASMISCSGEKPSPLTVDDIETALLEGHRNLLDGGPSAIRQFSMDADKFHMAWNHAAAEQTRRMKIADSDNIAPVCLLRVPTPADKFNPAGEFLFPVYSAEFLKLYKAEHDGKAGWFGRANNMPLDSIRYCDIVLIDPFKIDMRGSSIWIRELEAAWPDLQQIDRLVKQPSGDIYALDGMGILNAGHVSDAFTQAQPGLFKSGRDTRDIESACNSIEAPSGETEIGPEY